MLIDDINNSQALGEKYKSSSVSEQHLKDVEHIRDQIKTMLPSVVEVLMGVKNVKCITSDSIAEAERLIVQLSALKEKITNLDHSQVVMQLDNITMFKEQTDKKLEQIWANYRGDHYIPNANLIKSLLSVIDNDNRLDQLGELGNSISTKRIGDKKTVSDIKKYQEISTAIIKDLQMSSEVEEFVMKLSHGDEMVLSDVTDEIYAWLLEHHITKKIKIAI